MSVKMNYEMEYREECLAKIIVLNDRSPSNCSRCNIAF